MVRLVDIDPGNWRLNLKVAESQKTFVSSSAVLLARAYAYRNQRSRAFLIYDDDLPVGMGLYYDLPELACYDFSQLFIDERCQGRGFGREAVRLALEEMRADGRYGKVVLCYVEGNDAAKKLYEAFGFVEVPCDEDEEDDEIVMELTL